MNESTESPVDSYNRLIDDLVEYSESTAARLILKSGKYSNSKGTDELNKFVKTLSDKQREILAQMMNEQRQGGIHDVLATLSGWIECRGLTFQHHDQPMPVDLSGMGLHGDYIGRMNGWEWPGDDHKT